LITWSALCADNGIYVVLSYVECDERSDPGDGNPYGQVLDKGRWSDGARTVPRKNVDDIAAFWTSVAGRYKDDPNVMFNLWNEWDMLSLSQIRNWKAWTKQLFAAIRAAAPDTVIFVATNNNGENLRRLTPCVIDEFIGAGFSNWGIDMHQYFAEYLKSGCWPSKVDGWIDTAQRKGVHLGIHEWFHGGQLATKKISWGQFQYYLDVLVNKQLEKGISLCMYDIANVSLEMWYDPIDHSGITDLTPFSQMLAEAWDRIPTATKARPPMLPAPPRAPAPGIPWGRKIPTPAVATRPASTGGVILTFPHANANPGKRVDGTDAAVAGYEVYASTPGAGRNHSDRANGAWAVSYPGYEYRLAEFVPAASCTLSGPDVSVPVTAASILNTASRFRVKAVNDAGLKSQTYACTAQICVPGAEYEIATP